VQSYTSGRIPIQHADLYRLSSRAEVEDLGLRELADMGSVVVVEWGDVAFDVLGDALTVHLAHNDDADDERDITISVSGHGWDSRWDQLATAVRTWSVN
jgi:tRNA A37 threonylcarbamoyladenosine biosynthesis protein TsaE